MPDLAAVPYREDARPASPLDGVTLAQLEQRHDEYTRWARAWEDIRLLYRGGWEFLLAAGTVAATRAATVAQTNGAQSVVDALATGTMNRRRRFLWQFEGEPDVKYITVWEKAYLVPYFSAVLNYFRHWLFSKKAAIRPEMEDGEKTQPESPPWFPVFSGDVTGGGKCLDDFVKDAFLQALLCRRVGWMIGRPPMPPDMERSIEGQQFVPSQADAERMGLDRSLLTDYKAEEILDWETDGAGELLWVTLKKQARVRAFPEARKLIEVYTYIDRDEWRMWRGGRTGQGAGTQPEPMGGGHHGLGVVPFVMFELPHDLWIANQIHSLCVSIFNRQNRLTASEILACYPQPVLTSNDDTAIQRVMGEGIMLHCRAGTEKEKGETFGYAATPTGPYEHIKASIEASVQELYRAVHQLSLAVDTKAVSAVARSGTSKQEDRKSIEVILAAFGGYIREAIVRTLNVVSLVQGDGVRWAVEGFDDFDVTDLQDELNALMTVQGIEIHSQTASAEIEKRFLTGRILGQMDPARKVQVEREIDEHWQQQAEGVDQPFQFPGIGPDGLPIPPAPQPDVTDGRFSEPVA